MTIFISHSFTDKDQFDNVADAFEAGSVPFWRPSEITAGAPLSDQLRNAIERSDACVFIATASSVKSAWCGAEVGAFWGAGKRVFIYVADASLGEADLPKQFVGHFLERRLTRLVNACREHLAAATIAHDSARDGKPSLSLVMSQADFIQVIDAALDRSNLKATAIAAFLNLSLGLQVDTPSPKVLQAMLSQFLGLPRSTIQDGAARDWPYSLELLTTTGRWLGFAKNYEETGPLNQDFMYSPCVLFRFDENFRVSACVLSERVGDFGLWGLKSEREPIALAGRGLFGTQEGAGYVKSSLAGDSPNEA